MNLADFVDGKWYGRDGVWVEITKSGNTYSVKVSGLNVVTKYTMQMQAFDGTKFSKITKVSASTAKYLAPKVKKPTYSANTVNLEWAVSKSPIPAGATVVYEIGLYDKASKGINPLSAGFTIENNPSGELKKSFLAPKGKHTLGLRAIATLADGTVFFSATAKVNINVK